MEHGRPSSEHVERFRADLERLAPDPPKLGIAVSGGSDSLALLLLAAAAYPGQVEAATVDHGLRPASADEARLVADICARLGIPHQVLNVIVPDGKAGLQGEARAARYAALRSWAETRGVPFLLTAHHADDQAETLLMRVKRGAGPAGLSGIRAARPEGSLTLLRPLLGWTRDELREVVEAAKIAAVDDPSNRDPRFDRVEMRAFLAQNPQFEARRLARSAAALAEAEEALQWQAERLAGERCSEADGEWRIDVAGLPRELKRRLLAKTIAAIRRGHGLEPDWTGAEDVEGLLATLEAGGTATRAGIIARGGPVWTFALAPPRRS
jgi:tRNA(Ile)-lysidine synthase